MDVLSDILDTLRFRSCVYFTTDFRPPWGVSVPAFGNVARFHLAMTGGLWARVGNGPAEQLDEGDFILVPHGAPHTLSDHPERPFLDVGDIVREHGLNETGCLVYGGGEGDAATRMVCGHFEFDDGGHPLLSALPGRIVVRREAHGTAHWLDSILGLIAQETRSGRPGENFVLKRLTEILFVQAVRHWHDAQAGIPEGLLAALADRHVGRALNAIHGKSDVPWRVESLAREAGLSRTAFAERFRRMVGQSPMTYVTAWRMRRARLLLKESDFSIDRIAVEVGYQSAASFARMFRKTTGQSPGSVRRETAEPRVQ